MREWRKVPDYHYSICLSGEDFYCRNDNTGKEISTIKSNGRLFWKLWKNGIGKQQQIAVWIALSLPELIENEYFEGAEIDHKDTNPMNNNPSNLKWVTHKENINNPLTLNKIGKIRKGAKLSKETKDKISTSLKKTLQEQKREGI